MKAEHTGDCSQNLIFLSKHIEGEFFIVSDSDDVFDNRRIETLLQLMDDATAVSYRQCIKVIIPMHNIDPWIKTTIASAISIDVLSLLTSPPSNQHQVVEYYHTFANMIRQLNRPKDAGVYDEAVKGILNSLN